MLPLGDQHRTLSLGGEVLRAENGVAMHPVPQRERADGLLYTTLVSGYLDSFALGGFYPHLVASDRAWDPAAGRERYVMMSVASNDAIVVLAHLYREFVVYEQEKMGVGKL
jgi:hypothetical protein